MTNIKSNLFQILLVVFLIIGDLTRGDGECEDKMKALTDEYHNCVDQSATFQKFCEEADDVITANPDDEQISSFVKKYCTGIEKEMMCTKILTNSSNECRFLSQDAVDRSEGIGDALLSFFCRNDGKNFKEFTLNGELEKFDAYSEKNECESGTADPDLFTEDGEFDIEFCGKVNKIYACFADYYATADNQFLKDSLTELRDEIIKGAKCV